MEAQNNQSQENNFEKNRERIGGSLDDFIILQILSISKIGFVFKVRSKKNNEIYAMKISDLSLAQEKKVNKYYKNQTLILKQLKNENICQYYTDFVENNCLYIIMEYLDNGNLVHLKKLRLPEEKLIKIFLKCLNGLVYIHSKGIIHRNIKLDKILLDDNLNIKIIDFKMAAVSDNEKAKLFSKDEHISTQLVNHMTKIASGKFKAPEIDKDKYDNKIDVYSMGVVFCNLAYLTDSIPEKYEDTTYSKEL